MIFISSKSKLVQPEVNLGIILGFVCTHRLSRLVGKIKAKELIMTGKMLSAKEAYQLGLVNSIFKDNELMEQVLKVVKEILTKAPLAIAMTKRAINEGIDMPLETANKMEIMDFVYLISTEDQKEGMNAFIEKRKPFFKGK